MENWVRFLAGVVTNYISLYSFTTSEHCCEEDKSIEKCCNDIPCESNDIPCESNDIPCESNKTINNNLKKTNSYSNAINNTNQNITISSGNNLNIKHNTKHWSIPILVGDLFCNFNDGILITTAFLICGLKRLL